LKLCYLSQIEEGLAAKSPVHDFLNADEVKPTPSENFEIRRQALMERSHDRGNLSSQSENVTALETKIKVLEQENQKLHEHVNALEGETKTVRALNKTYKAESQDLVKQM
jgi:adenylate kinase family enzyme